MQIRMVIDDDDDDDNDACVILRVLILAILMTLRRMRLTLILLIMRLVIVVRFVACNIVMDRGQENVVFVKVLDSQGKTYPCLECKQLCCGYWCVNKYSGMRRPYPFCQACLERGLNLPMSEKGATSPTPTRTGL